MKKLDKIGKVLIILMILAFVLIVFLCCVDKTKAQERTLIYSYSNIERLDLGNGQYRFSMQLAHPFQVWQEENKIFNISGEDTVFYDVKDINKHKGEAIGGNWTFEYSDVNADSFMFEIGGNLDISIVEEQINVMIGRVDTIEKHIKFDKDGITKLRLLDVKGFDLEGKEIKVKSIEKIDKEVKYKFEKEVKIIDPTLSWQPDDTQGIDSYVDSENPNTNYGTTGNLNINFDPTVPNIRRTYIKFAGIEDSVGLVIVDSANIIFQIGYWRAVFDTLSVHYALGSWLEDSITWNNQRYSVGIDTSIIDTNYVQSDSDLYIPIKNIAQNWIDRDSVNTGVCVKTVKDSASVFYDVGIVVSSSDWMTNILERPKIEIYYTVGVPSEILEPKGIVKDVSSSGIKKEVGSSGITKDVNK